MELLNYDLSLSDISNYKNNYKINCLLNKKSIIIKTAKNQLMSNLNSGYIVIELNNYNKRNEVLSQFIKKIEIESGDKIKLKLKKKYKIHTSFVGDQNKYIFKNNNKDMVIFDKNKSVLNKSNVEIYSDIILLLKLQDIWINIEKKTYGLNWTILQCRIFPQFNYKECILLDSDDEEKSEINIKELIVQKCVFCNSICTYNNTSDNIIIGAGKGKTKGKGKGGGYDNSNNGKGGCYDNSNNGKGGVVVKKPVFKKPDRPMLIPTANELMNIKSKLKKMKKIVDSDSD
tara:strand:+ start:173 stop:1033 length:861 start_codon:yes stop_codon:yes gene_type:complete